MVAVRAATWTGNPVTKAAVPLKLEEGDMPLNTFSNKAPFKATIQSVERIVGPKATGETMHIVIKTDVRPPYPAAGIVQRSCAHASHAGQGPLLGGSVLRRHPPCE